MDYWRIGGGSMSVRIRVGISGAVNLSGSVNVSVGVLVSTRLSVTVVEVV